MQMDTNLDPFALRAFGLCLNEPAVTGSCWEASILALIGPSRSTLDRDIYLTPPGPTGCGLTNLANGTGSVCMAC
jgi:hypothetical protein